MSRTSIVLMMAALLLAGCKSDYSANRYDAAAVQQANKVDRAVVIGFRQVRVSAQGTIGAVTGGAAGGVLGSQVPGGGISSAFGVLSGSLVGGIFGSAAEHATGDQKAWEYIVKQPNGDLLSVTQTDPAPLAVGTAVLVITGKQARIVPDYTVSLDATPSERDAKPATPAATAAATPGEPASPPPAITAISLPAPAKAGLPPSLP